MTQQRVSEIEDAICAGERNVYQVFTQMRQLIQGGERQPSGRPSPMPTTVEEAVDLLKGCGEVNVVGPPMIKASHTEFSFSVVRNGVFTQILLILLSDGTVVFSTENKVLDR